MEGMAHKETSSMYENVTSGIGSILNRLTSWAIAYKKRLNGHGSEALVELYSENLAR